MSRCKLIKIILLIIVTISGNLRLCQANKIHITKCAACLTINDENIKITPSTCNAKDGSITGIQVNNAVGTPSFVWKDSQGNVVGSNADLTNVPTGTYIVTVKDDSKCKAVTSQSYIVPIKDPVSFDDSNTKITNASCNQNDGSVTNINAVNAVTYAWFDYTGKQISASANLINVIAGAYKLVATNKDGCSNSATYTVGGAAMAPKLIKVDTVDIDCARVSYFKFTFNITATDPIYDYFIKDSLNNDIAQGIIVFDPDPDSTTYIRFDLKPLDKITLIIRDPNGCLTNMGTFIKPAAQIIIDDSKVYVYNDRCSAHVGEIINLHLKDVPSRKPLRQKIIWQDASGKIIQGALLPITGLGAGTYTVTVSDPNGCIASKTYTITDSVGNTTQPIVSDIKICLPQVVSIIVKNPASGTFFRLYGPDSALIKESKSPNISQLITTSGIYYVTAVDGSCESAKTKVNITVALPGLVIPGTFTPNGDGVNDYWDITGIEQYPGTEIFIYNRYGTLVYHTTDYSSPFNGTVSGKLLPSGVYYYLLDPKKPECKGKISGSLMIIR